MFRKHCYKIAPYDTMPKCVLFSFQSLVKVILLGSQSFVLISEMAPMWESMLILLDLLLRRQKIKPQIPFNN